MTDQLSNKIGNVIRFICNFRQFSSELSAELKPFGLAPDGFLVLFLLSGDSEQTTTRLAESLGMNLPTATKLLDRLVADNYVHRKPHPNDRRVVRILLTKEGELKAMEVAEAFEKFLEDFSKREPDLAHSIVAN